MADYNSIYTGAQIDDGVGKSLAALPADNTLSTTGKAADAKKTGDELNDLKSTKAPAIIDTASGAIAHFEDGADGLPLKKLVVNIEPMQSGSGDPSPQNVRPITGWTNANIYREAVYDSAASPIADIPFSSPPGTVYGGTLTINDDGTGTLIVDKEIISLDGSAQWVELNSNSGKFYANAIPANSAKESADYISNLYLFAGNGASQSSAVTIDKRFYGQNKYGRFWVYDSDYLNNLDGFKSALNTTPLQIVYPLNNSLSYTLTAEQITTLLGTNNVWADCGDVSVEYPADTKLYIHENDSVNSALYAPYTVQTWTKGLVNAINRNITTSDNGATAGPIPADKITFSSGCRAVIRMWKNGSYLGKCKDDGTIDKASGHWRYFTGEVDTASLMQTYNADSFDFSILPTDGTSITTETVATYGNSHCAIFVNRFATKAMVTEVGSDVAFAQNTADYAQSSVANVKVINHRGFNTVAPENTLPAFELSAQHGFAYVETDVLFTAPDTNNPLGVPVLLHDATINRTARNPDGTAISNTINIADITYEQALQYDFGIWKGEQWAGTKIPTFDAFIKLCKKYGLHPYIELKNEKTYSQDEIDLILSIITANGMKKNVSFISYDDDALTLVKNRWDWVELGMHTSDGNVSTIQGLMTGKNEVFATHGMYVSIPNVIAAGIPACPYTVDTIAQLQGLDPYYSYILTNVLTLREIQDNMFAPA